MNKPAFRAIKIEAIPALISSVMWLSLLVGAVLSFCMLSGYPLPGAKIWVVLVPTAMLLSVFSSVVSQVSRSRI